MNELEELSTILTAEDFGLPVEPLPYRDGELVTRQNFGSFLERSFAFSRGNVRWQIGYLEWIKAQTGFDYEITLKNFLQVGGFTSLSLDEQQAFIQAFESVMKHKTSEDNVWDDFNANPAGQFNDQLRWLLTDNEDYTMKQHIVERATARFGSLTGMNRQQLEELLRKDPRKT